MKKIDGRKKEISNTRNWPNSEDLSVEIDKTCCVPGTAHSLNSRTEQQHLDFPEHEHEKILKASREPLVQVRSEQGFKRGRKETCVHEEPPRARHHVSHFT